MMLSMAYLLLVVVSAAAVFHNVQSFSPPVLLFPPSSLLLKSTVSVRRRLLYAKPPPTAGVDLDAIEAYEEELYAAVVEDDLQLLEDGDDYDDELEQSSAQEEQVKLFDVPDSVVGKRIDAALAVLEPELSRSFFGNLVALGKVSLVDNNKADQVVINRKSYKVELCNVGQQIRVSFPPDDGPGEIVAQNIPLEILYEDEHMIVINKAADMVVHPAVGNWDGTVVNALAYYLTTSPYGSGEFVEDPTDNDGSGRTNEKDNDETSTTEDGETVRLRPGIVHRLDKGTTGVLIVAKTRESHAALAEDFSNRKIMKNYLAITVGKPGERVTIDKPIGRHPIHRQRMRVIPDPHKSDGGRRRNIRSLNTTPVTGQLKNGGRSAMSYVDTIAFDGRLGFCRVRIVTGRTHQIRVHLQDQKTPIYGDDVYGLSDWNKRLLKTHNISRPLLHAYKIKLRHPVTREKMIFEAPMPADMLKIAKTIYPDGPEVYPDIFETGDPETIAKAKIDREDWYHFF